MNWYVWCGIGLAVYVLAKAYNDMQASPSLPVQKAESEMRKRLDAVVVLRSVCVTEEDRQALEKVTACVLRGGDVER